jgi:hypothetical protein
MGKAIASAAPQLHRSWVGPDCAFELKQDEGKIELIGSFFREQSGLLAGLLNQSVWSGL